MDQKIATVLNVILSFRLQLLLHQSNKNIANHFLIKTNAFQLHMHNLEECFEFILFFGREMFMVILTTLTQ